jgi:hypothetical protein
MLVFRGTVAVLVAVLGIALVVAGCGGADSGAVAITANPDLTKAELIKQGDAICEKTDKLQESGLKAYTQKNPEAESNKAGQSKMVIAVGLPPIQTEAEELAALGAPSGDEDKVAAIVEGIEGAVEKSEEDPASLLGGAQGAQNHFTAVGKLAAEYGFKACNNAL